jgi:predicted metal-binding membrane protein
MNTLAPEWRKRPATLVACVLVFIASTWVTILWCGPACDMPGMGTWDRMPHQSRLDHFLVFEAMWIVMMIAMMMPVFAPALLRFRHTLSGPPARSRWQVLLFAVAYFVAWALPGLVIYPLGVAASQLVDDATPWDRVTAMAGSLLVLAAGLFQFSPAKRRQIECCRIARVPGATSPPGWRQAGFEGWRIGVDCVICCAGLTATLLVVGVMDVLAMAAVTVGIAAERLLPPHARMERAVGAILIAMGVFLLARTLTGG